ncbi:hypothetical protein EGT09_15165 [Pseudomonas putida]|uniref:hypothetical protein n=1 Tax=Pseudomonas putida TaxID=303 RepID=UPI000F797838|nr:hypothetical protein [Pseudomonas putida]RSC27683.1 hypothetical protein EGT09_15165 [Pseudomonas putida]HEK0906163.1 hypothetical protein [Pseudomonas putida]
MINEEIKAVLAAPTIEDFNARIYLLQNEEKVPLRFSRPNEHLAWGVFNEANWLQAGGMGESPLFSMKFLSKTPDRLWFKLMATGYGDNLGQLGFSKNGYLGLYDYNSTTYPWKIELLDWADGYTRCHLRDHRGIRVGVCSEHTEIEGHKMHYLSIQDTQPAEFVIHKVDVPGIVEGTSWLHVY